MRDVTMLQLARCARVDAVAATAPSSSFMKTLHQDMDTGKSFCASPGTGMGTGASLKAAPAEASLPTSITKSFAGWPSFFS